MVIGIPERGKITKLPTLTKPFITESVIQKHDSIGNAKLHYDLRLLIDGVGHSWAIKNFPAQPGDKTLAIKVDDHSSEYFDFSGTIPSGYGAGKVSKYFRGKAEALRAEPNKISFVYYEGQVPQRFTLVKLPGNAVDYLLVNHTPSAKRNLPTGKEHYKLLDPNKLDPNNPKQVFSPKVDGAHNLMVLRNRKSPEFFSYRTSKRSKSGLIDHTYKIPTYKAEPAKDAGSLTILRSEVFGVDKKTGRPLTNSQVAGMLNSNTLKSRVLQEQQGTLDYVNFEPVVYKGKINIIKSPLLLLQNSAL